MDSLVEGGVDGSLQQRVPLGTPWRGHDDDADAIRRRHAAAHVRQEGAWKPRGGPVGRVVGSPCV